MPGADTMGAGAATIGGDIITAITGITTLTTPIVGPTPTITPIMVTLTGSRPGCASISGAAA